MNEHGDPWHDEANGMRFIGPQTRGHDIATIPNLFYHSHHLCALSLVYVGVFIQNTRYSCG